MWLHKTPQKFSKLHPIPGGTNEYTTKGTNVPPHRGTTVLSISKVL